MEQNTYTHRHAYVLLFRSRYSILPAIFRGLERIWCVRACVRACIHICSKLDGSKQATKLKGIKHFAYGVWKWVKELSEDSKTSSLLMPNSNCLCWDTVGVWVSEWMCIYSTMFFGFFSIVYLNICICSPGSCHFVVLFCCCFVCARFLFLRFFFFLILNTFIIISFCWARFQYTPTLDIRLIVAALFSCFLFHPYEHMCARAHNRLAYICVWAHALFAYVLALAFNSLHFFHHTKSIYLFQNQDISMQWIVIFFQ